jgi:DNA-directed RNA polymerase sigma subunit (sigma70/sigma32)
MGKFESIIQLSRVYSGQSELTLKEIANMLDLTKERVRQIEAKALTKLRKKLQEKGIKPSDLLDS